jgi:hypothetical protein
VRTFVTHHPPNDIHWLDEEKWIEAGKGRVGEGGEEWNWLIERRIASWRDIMLPETCFIFLTWNKISLFFVLQCITYGLS